MKKTASEKKISLLFVDDDEMIRLHFTNFFEDLGYKIITANEGLKGLNLFKTNKINFIITDIRMEGMDGIKLYHEIRKIDSKVTFIFISGNISEDIPELKNIDSKDYYFFKKPIKTNKLTNLINSINKEIN